MLKDARKPQRMMPTRSKNKRELRSCRNWTKNGPDTSIKTHFFPTVKKERNLMSSAKKRPFIRDQREI
jgi:hypothetical protein